MKNLNNKDKLEDQILNHKFDFSKSLGQNFLINNNIRDKIVEESGITEDSNVLEIGPGMGVLTHKLASIAKKVICIEIDKRLIPILNDNLSEFGNLKIINEDILKLNLKDLMEKEFANKNIFVCANLPYYITSPIIMKLLEEKLPIVSITVMIQKEAAERICAKPGTRNSGAISLAVRYYSKPKILFNVSKGNFIPPPNVESSVTKLDILKVPPVLVNDENLFFSLIRAGFSKRRKTILNSFSSGMSVSKDIIEKVLKLSEIESNLRAEQLTLEDFSKISNNLKSFIKGETK